ncbi:hypothetical protein GcM1_129006 [Golovinomyces cichoracearum]|uniref:Transposase Tc1-like domain-containing protein n=1 Tax=Golovinomyces cichoracearum TaxID=62708 RepID=A0A420JBZ5_9PEZI|nr:hypothetical protein GcM1_129006 [Golovinomyces cichoracearum]
MDQTLHYPNIFNRNSTSALNIEPAISAPGDFHPYILTNETQDVQSLSHGKRYKSKETSEADRSKIRALANTGMSCRNISNLLHLTERQVQYVLTQSVTPKKNRWGRKYAMSGDKAQELVNWVLSDSSHREAKFSEIPTTTPYLNLVNVGEKAIRSALKRNGYERRVAKKKVISTSDNHKTTRLNFVRWGLTWYRERLYNQSFSDEMWASGGVNSRSFVMVLVEGDKEDVVRGQ